MRAVVIDRFGGPEVLEVREQERPAAQRGQVVFRVEAAGIDPVDSLIRRGTFGGIRLPHVVGVDLAGETVSVPPGATSVSVGQRVYAHLKGGNGTLAEYVALPEASVSPAPPCLSPEEAAAVPCAALTAYQALTEVMRVQAGESLLVTGAADGVGHFAVQMAVAMGLRVRRARRTTRS